MPPAVLAAFPLVCGLTLSGFGPIWHAAMMLAALLLVCGLALVGLGPIWIAATLLTLMGSMALLKGLALAREDVDVPGAVSKVDAALCETAYKDALFGAAALGALDGEIVGLVAVFAAGVLVLDLKDHSSRVFVSLSAVHFMVGCPLVAAAVNSSSVQLDRWIVPHHAVRASFLYSRWTCRVSQPVRCTPLWPASWLPALDKSRESKSVEVQRVWDVYDERLQFMSREDALNLDEALLNGDVSSAWMVWSSAAEKALADAFQLAGGPVPSRGQVLGRGMVRMRTVRLGGPVVRSVRRNAADVGEVDDVSLYRDSSAAPVLDLRRKLKAVLNLLDAIVRSGASLTGAVELSHLWDCVVRCGPLGSVCVEEYFAARTCGVGESRRLVAGLHDRVSTFIRGIVARRRNVGINAWRSWLREDPLVHPYRWLRADRLPPSPFLQCDRALTPGGSGVLADPAGIDGEFRKAWLPYFVALGKGRPALMNSILSVMGGCRVWGSFHYRL